MPRPARPKIYHIVHVGRLASIATNGGLWCDAEVARNVPPETTIGMSDIKARRLRLPLTSYPDIMVGSCVPFYFCPRSVMLYLIFKDNHPNLQYHGGQDPIVHLEADLGAAVEWARQSNRRWAFTLSNAGSGYFEDRCDLAHLNEINWDAVQARDWRTRGHGKQAEFLMHEFFPWELVERVAAKSLETLQAASQAMVGSGHRPRMELRRDWYY